MGLPAARVAVSKDGVKNRGTRTQSNAQAKSLRKQCRQCEDSGCLVRYHSCTTHRCLRLRSCYECRSHKDTGISVPLLQGPAASRCRMDRRNLAYTWASSSPCQSSQSRLGSPPRIPAGDSEDTSNRYWRSRRFYCEAKNEVPFVWCWACGAEM